MYNDAHNFNSAISLIAPDDWHCHLRDGDQLSRTVPDIADQFRRAIVMPNLNPPVTTAAMALSYRQRIMRYVPEGVAFEPLMTLYLTDATTPAMIKEAAACGCVYACKLYPAGATTHSTAGVHDLHQIYPALEMMQQVDLPLLIHGEIADPALDIFDREADFVTKQLTQLVRDFPALRMVLEHVSSKIGVDFVLAASAYVAATITVHHLLLNRNSLLTGGIFPHHYCLPVVKTAEDQAALLQAATSGHPKFFLGTDSAPHAVSRKECAMGAAGIYTAYSAIELYAQVFAEHQALDQLEQFASLNGPAFYRLPVNDSLITLVKQAWTIPESLAFGADLVKPLWAGQSIDWQLAPISAVE